VNGKDPHPPAPSPRAGEGEPEILKFQSPSNHLGEGLKPLAYKKRVRIMIHARGLLN